MGQCGTGALTLPHSVGQGDDVSCTVTLGSPMETISKEQKEHIGPPKRRPGTTDWPLWDGVDRVQAPAVSAQSALTSPSGLEKL